MDNVWQSQKQLCPIMQSVSQPYWAMLEAYNKRTGLTKHKFPCHTVQNFRGLYKKGEMNIISVELKKVN